MWALQAGGLDRQQGPPPGCPEFPLPRRHPSMPGPCLSPPARPQGPHPPPNAWMHSHLPSVPPGFELSKGLLLPCPCHPVTPPFGLTIYESHPLCTKLGTALQLFGPTGPAGYKLSLQSGMSLGPPQETTQPGGHPRCLRWQSCNQLLLSDDWGLTQGPRK